MLKMFFYYTHRFICVLIVLLTVLSDSHKNLRGEGGGEGGLEGTLNLQSSEAAL